MHHWGFVIEQLTRGDERLREERRRHARRTGALAARSTRPRPPSSERLDG